ncbi:hypothetical protein J3E72DRAFT_264163 [Bipolaris maydis]|nr:hypothetical protein J3E72DRAFT_264163 [Bipolaris maydis]
MKPIVFLAALLSTAIAASIPETLTFSNEHQHAIPLIIFAISAVVQTAVVTMMEESIFQPGQSQQVHSNKVMVVEVQQPQRSTGTNGLRDQLDYNSVNVLATSNAM